MHVGVLGLLCETPAAQEKREKKEFNVNFGEPTFGEGGVKSDGPNNTHNNTPNNTNGVAKNGLANGQKWTGPNWIGHIGTEYFHGLRTLLQWKMSLAWILEKRVPVNGVAVFARRRACCFEDVLCDFRHLGGWRGNPTVAAEIHARRLIGKEVLMQENGEHFFPDRR